MNLIATITELQQISSFEFHVILVFACFGSILIMLGISQFFRYTFRPKEKDYLRLTSGLVISPLGGIIFGMAMMLIYRSNYAYHSIIQLPIDIFVLLFGLTVVLIYTIISCITGFEIPLYEKDEVE